MNKIVIIRTTESNQENANLLVNRIMNSRLAGCVSISKVKSIYWWNKKILKDDEYEISFKTISSQRKDLIDELIKYHSYDLPQILSYETDCSSEYYAWINEVIRNY